MSMIVWLFACGVPTESGETGCSSATATPVAVDDVGGKACAVGAEPTTGELVAETTIDGPTWIHVLAQDCAPNACQVGADPQCTATVDGARVLVDVSYDYTPDVCMACTEACMQLWLACEVEGGLPAGSYEIVYEDEAPAALTVPYTGAPVCSGAP